MEYTIFGLSTAAISRSFNCRGEGDIRQRHRKALNDHIGVERLQDVPGDEGLVDAGVLV